MKFKDIYKERKMSVSESVCPKCGKQCRDKRGVTIHLKKCGDIKEFICNACNAEFTAHNSLLVHYNRCKIIKQQNQEKEIAKQQESLKLELLEKQERILSDVEKKDNELQKLQDKLKEIELKHEQDLKESMLKHQEELKDLNVKIRSDYEEQIKMRDKDLNQYYNEINSAKDILKEKEKFIDYIQGQLNESKVDLHTVREINAKLSMKDTTTTIINNDNRVQLQSLDPSMIQGRIQPPDYVIGTVNDLVSMLRSLGVRNCFRVNDKSRGTLSWNKPGEGEIRDPKGDQLLTHIIDSLSDDLTKEKCYFEEELKKLYESEEQDVYQINESRIFVNFCTQLLHKDPDILKKIKKELVKQGRIKGDPEQDQIREVSYNKFITSILTTLFPKILVWIEMTFFELGQYIGRKIKDRYHLEGASREDLYIVVHTDGGGRKQIFSKKLMFYITEAIAMAIESDLVEEMLTEILLFKAVNKERVEMMLNYIKNPSLDETVEIMKGIVSL